MVPFLPQLDHAPSPIKQVLLLGSGIAESVRNIHQRFPHAYITIVENDTDAPQKGRHLFERPNQVERKQGAWKEVVADLRQPFDVILLDLSIPHDSEPCFSSPETVQHLSRILAHDGFLFVNALEKKESFAPAFTKYSERNNGRTTCIEFRHQGLGHNDDPLPPHFIHPLQSPDYLKGTVYVNDSHAMLLGGGKNPYGMRRFMGSLAMDLYNNQEEPVVEPFNGWRMIVWQPAAKRPRPAGWLPWFIPSEPKQHAVAQVLPGDYWMPWTDHAKRHRKKWLAQNDLVIEEISFEEFVEGFIASGKLPRERTSAIEALHRRIAHPNHHVRFFGVRHDEQVIAALAVCDLADISLSVHCAAFIHPDFEKTSVGTGLIDYWYKECQQQHIRFAYFDIMWSPGDPKGWMGYSKFKKQFRPYLLTSPLPFVKFTAR